MATCSAALPRWRLALVALVLSLDVVASAVRASPARATPQAVRPAASLRRMMPKGSRRCRVQRARGHHAAAACLTSPRGRRRATTPLRQRRVRTPPPTFGRIPPLLLLPLTCVRTSSGGKRHALPHCHALRPQCPGRDARDRASPQPTQRAEADLSDLELQAEQVSLTLSLILTLTLNP